MGKFDPALADIKEHPAFEPFQVHHWISLQEAIEKGKVAENEPVLFAEVAGKPLTLLTRQMTYHHVAQGTIGENPWMVSF